MSWLILGKKYWKFFVFGQLSFAMMCVEIIISALQKFESILGKLDSTLAKISSGTIFLIAIFMTSFLPSQLPTYTTLD